MSGVADSRGRLRVESLGPVETSVDGRPIALDDQRPQALVARLPLIGGAWCVTTSWWGDEFGCRAGRWKGKNRVRGVLCPFAVRRIVIVPRAP
jgi:hypothetical protein